MDRLFWIGPPACPAMATAWPRGFVGHASAAFAMPSCAGATPQGVARPAPAGRPARMNRFLAACAGSADAMMAPRMPWLGVIARPLHRRGIGQLVAESPNVAVAALFHLLHALGLVVFALAPRRQSPSGPTTLALGALFGIFAYAAHALTHLATRRDWPLRLALFGIGWGALLGALSTAGGKAALDCPTGARP